MSNSNTSRANEFSLAPLAQAPAMNPQIQQERVYARVWRKERDAEYLLGCREHLAEKIDEMGAETWCAVNEHEHGAEYCDGKNEVKDAGNGGED